MVSCQVRERIVGWAASSQRIISLGPWRSRCLKVTTEEDVHRLQTLTKTE